jgi:ubiquinone/menaquinone biosynthesis C-methylase UbiE
MTNADLDQEMVDAASARLAEFGDRVTVRQADATALPFPDGSFDAVLSWIMLHHTTDQAILTGPVRRWADGDMRGR